MWYTAISASVTTGATVVAVTTGDDISIIQEDSGLIFEGESPVQVKRGYIDGFGDKFIELASPWPYTDKVAQPIVAYPTDASFAEATAELRRVIDTLEVASTVDMQTATNDVKISTPLKVKQAIDFHAYNKAAADAEFVSRSDIVGTVSQSGGVPTGAIIERGSNANGEYVRYADGTMICKYLGDTNTSAIYPQTHSWNSFPSTFQDNPTILCQGISWRGGDIINYHYTDVRMAGRGDFSSGVAVCQVFTTSRDGGNPTNATRIMWQAIGRWY